MQKIFNLVIITAAGLAAVGSANAQTQYSMTYDQDILGDYNLTIGGTSLLQNNGQPLTAIEANYLTGTPVPPPNLMMFYTFCVDILGTWNNNPTVTAEPFPMGNQAPTGWVNNGIETAANIYNAFYGNITITSGGGGQFGGSGPSYTGEEWGAALQLAIWTDLYGSYNPITQTGFSYNNVTDSNVPVLTAEILGSSANVPNPNLTSTFLLATPPTGSNQSFIGPEPVPEPTTLVLAGLGGISVLLLRRRK